MMLAAIEWHSVFFMFFAMIACAFAAAVAFTSNIVRMAFYLTICLGAVAVLFILAGAEFVGAMQLMIYVGGTLVLLIFGVMLTAQERFVSMTTPPGEWVLAVIVGGALMAPLLTVAFGVRDWREPNEQRAELTLEDAETTASLGLALAGGRVDKLSEENETLRNGMSGYLLPFVVVSVHLLVVLIGAGYMARTRRSVDARGS